ncbi:alpha/beta hydrolase [Staphylococcus haemolyticus]|nr:alpha/beta hydrolase [Staphylococcus haemolyticus]
MRTFKKIIFSLIISLMIFTLVGCQSKSNNSSNYQSNDKKQVATLFMHGYGGTNNSEKYMVKQTVKKKCYKGCSYSVCFYQHKKNVLTKNEIKNEITVDKDGKPSKMNADYEKLLGLKDVYKNKNIEVLNIYGDLKDGTHSDGRVSNSSSRSLKYLLGNSPKTYKESEYKGEKAQHSALHHNKEVSDEIINFLWQ